MIRSFLYLSLLLGYINPCEALPTDAKAMAKKTTRTFAHKDFDKLHVSHVCQVEVYKAKAHSIKIQISALARADLRVEKQGKTLRIGLRPGRHRRGIICTGRVGMPQVKALMSSGAATLKMGTFGAQPALTLSSSGASKLWAKGQFQALDVRASGSSHIKLQGTTKSLKLRASGASRLALEKLAVVQAKVVASGACRVALTIKKRLDLRASGASRLTYAGNPQITQKVSGVASVSQR